MAGDTEAQPMSLLNPALAIGAIALLIPLLIHIFNRSRFRD